MEEDQTQTVCDCGRWTLELTGGDLRAERDTPNGQIVYTTEDSDVTYQQGGRHNQTDEEVVQEFVRNAQPGERVSDLLHVVKMARDPQ